MAEEHKAEERELSSVELKRRSDERERGPEFRTLRCELAGLHVTE